MHHTVLIYALREERASAGTIIAETFQAAVDITGVTEEQTRKHADTLRHVQC